VSHYDPEYIDRAPLVDDPEQACQACDGFGQFLGGWPCSACKGSGERPPSIDERVAASVRETVRVPPLTCQQEVELARRAARMDRVYRKHIEGKTIELAEFLAARGR
jgi:DnaJ-class molecular chaperone